jgi:transcriptional regulator with XRE-family HTH domain
LTTGVSYDKLTLVMGTESSKTLGDRIRELRDKRDLSLRELGHKLDKSAAFLSDVELGRRHPSENVLADMARVLGTTIEDLKSYDVRPTVQELKRLVNQNPALGYAFRKVLDKDVTAQELIDLLEQKGARKKP